MPPYFCIMFLIVLSSFLLSTLAYSHDVVKCRPEIETHIEWTDLVSKIVNGIRGSFPEAPFSVPLSENLKSSHPETRSADKKPDIQQRLEALLSEETGKIIRSFESVVNSSVALSTMLYDVLDATTTSDNVPPLLAKLVAIARDDLYARLPLPATARGHTKRVERVSEALENLQQITVRFARNQHIDQEIIERHFDNIKPIFRDVGVVIGDVVELYPAAVEALVLNLSAVLLPEASILRSLVILYCLGPYVLGKDAISGWLMKQVSES